MEQRGTGFGGLFTVPSGVADPDCGGGMERLEQVGTVFRGLFTVPSGGAGARAEGRKRAWHQGRCMQDTPRVVEAYSPIMGGGRR